MNELIHRQKILIVDDAQINYEILAGMLEDDYDTVYAANGREAVNILEHDSNEFVLVLLDLNMPVMDGYGVLNHMRTHKWLDTLPVIIISAESSTDFVGRAYDLGATDYFVRPFDARIVLRRVKNTIALYERYDRDSVVDGYNRKGLIHQAEIFLKYAADPTQYAVLFFDIRNFKAINEMFGIDGGDNVLRQFYRTVMDSELKPLIGSRVEGDHFVFMVHRDRLDSEVLISLCEHNYEQNNIKQHIYCRCGIYHIEDKVVPVSGMIDRAKLAKEVMADETAKPYAVFDQSMRVTYVDQAQLVMELEEGIANEQFKVFFQPVIDTATGQIASAEALVRWIHPQRGFISPGLFIPAFEKEGYISRLDMYVLSKVRAFIGERCEMPQKVVPVSVNLSWMDFYNDAMMKRIIADLESDDLPEGMVRFEITETSYARIENNQDQVIDRMRACGAKILMDDFGSGYSSFGLLQDHSFDILKIDMQFVRQIDVNPKTNSILQAIIQMAHRLDIKVVAEGVETKAQADFLKQHGCDYIQGYYYSKPLPLEDFIKYLDGSNA